MSDDARLEVERAMRAVRKAYDDLQALRTSRDSMVSLSLLAANTGLDKLSCNLNLLVSSVEALTGFGACTLVSTGTSLSNALVHDMEAVARRFESMMPTGSAEELSDMHEQECKDIAEMVDGYDRTIFSVLIQRNVCAPTISFIFFELIS
jgi:hypothetical protein